MSDEREPRWRVWRNEPGGEDEAQEYPILSKWSQRRLYEARDVAEYWAQCWDSDSAEYSIVAQEEEPVVIVEDLENGKREWFQVCGEAVPEYTAHPYEPK